MVGQYPSHKPKLYIISFHFQFHYPYINLTINLGNSTQSIEGDAHMFRFRVQVAGLAEGRLVFEMPKL